MATAPSSTSSSSCTAVPRWGYDVFLSFRRHLHRLRQPPPQRPRHSKVCTFIDDELWQGERISLLLEQAIKSSRIAIVLFSPNFAASTWCLQELTKILEMQDSKGQLFQPVFFHVDPSDLQKQTGIFAEIMARQEEAFGGVGGGDGSERVKKWREHFAEWLICPDGI
ncbi:LOW QUALITY PROTEIN: hypothetical protein BT93_H0071 [Corymbia citriodora subsp. variegata]|nr:LOW QUALITY PROTEIN: hypothetical protein BT93_H0071 [Corymbia citriodora subsp. variegata]